MFVINNNNHLESADVQIDPFDRGIETDTMEVTAIIEIEWLLLYKEEHCGKIWNQ